MKKNQQCPKTMSGKHSFVAETQIIGHAGYRKINFEKTFFGLADAMTIEYIMPDIRFVKTGRTICEYCGMIDDRKKDTR